MIDVGHTLLKYIEIIFHINSFIVLVTIYSLQA